MSRKDLSGGKNVATDTGDPVLDGIVHMLRSELPESADDGPEKVMAAVRAAAEAGHGVQVGTRRGLGRRLTSYWGRLADRLRPPVRARTWVPAAATLVMVLTVGGLLMGRSRDQSAAPREGAVQVIQLVFIGSKAHHVAVAGDFNDWRPTPLRRSASGDMWTIELRLRPGRHTYAFRVDGKRWVADQAAPTAGENEFGVPISVLILPKETA